MSSAAAHEARIVPRRSTAQQEVELLAAARSPALAGEDVGPGVVDPGVHPPEARRGALRASDAMSSSWLMSASMTSTRRPRSRISAAVVLGSFAIARGR